MRYRAEEAKPPTDDAEDQLAEWTIRDHGYLVNDGITIKTRRELPDNQLVTLINYAVFNGTTSACRWRWRRRRRVVPQKGEPGGSQPHGLDAGSHPDVYGWTGAVNPIDFSENTSGTQRRRRSAPGTGFGGKGWPFYNIPTHERSGCAHKVPVRCQHFAQGPLEARAPARQPEIHALERWHELISETIGWAGGKPGQPPALLFT